jgi:hypothetical protein
MLIADRLLQRIEANWEQIVARVIADRDGSPHLTHYRLLSDEETRERAHELATRMAVWLHDRDETPHIEHFERLGRDRRAQGVPLHEVILKLNILKHAIRRYATEQNYRLTALEIYDELELLRAMAAFFDFVAFRITKGYQEAGINSCEEQTDPILTH